MCDISTFAQNKTILFFSICKCSSFLLVQMAKGCFCSTGTGIPPLSVHSLPVEGLYQESWIHKGLYFELLFKFLSFLNDVERLQLCGPERLSMFCIRRPPLPLQMAACTLVSNPCQWYLCRQNLDLLFKMDAEYCRWSNLLPLENYCCENMQYQSVHKVSSRLRPLEGKNKRIWHYLTNRFQKEPDLPVQGINSCVSTRNYWKTPWLLLLLFLNNIQTVTHICWLGIQNTFNQKISIYVNALDSEFFNDYRRGLLLKFKTQKKMTACENREFEDRNYPSDIFYPFCTV